MTVKLSVKAEAYIQELVRDGRHGNAEQIVDLLILKRRADERHDTEFPSLPPAQVEAELLRGVRSPHRAWAPGEFRNMAQTLMIDQAGE